MQRPRSGSTNARSQHNVPSKTQGRVKGKSGNSAIETSAKTSNASVHFIPNVGLLSASLQAFVPKGDRSPNQKDKHSKRSPPRTPERQRRRSSSVDLTNASSVPKPGSPLTFHASQPFSPSALQNLLASFPPMGNLDSQLSKNLKSNSEPQVSSLITDLTARDTHNGAMPDHMELSKLELEVEQIEQRLRQMDQAGTLHSSPVLGSSPPISQGTASSQQSVSLGLRNGSISTLSYSPMSAIPRIIGTSPAQATFPTSYPVQSPSPPAAPVAPAVDQSSPLAANLEAAFATTKATSSNTPTTAVAEKPSSGLTKTKSSGRVGVRPAWLPTSSKHRDERRDPSPRPMTPGPGPGSSSRLSGTPTSSPLRQSREMNSSRSSRSQSNDRSKKNNPESELALQVKVLQQQLKEALQEKNSLAETTTVSQQRLALVEHEVKELREKNELTQQHFSDFRKLVAEQLSQMQRQLQLQSQHQQQQHCINTCYQQLLRMTPKEDEPESLLGKEKKSGQNDPGVGDSAQRSTMSSGFTSQHLDPKIVSMAAGSSLSTISMGLQQRSSGLPARKVDPKAIEGADHVEHGTSTVYTELNPVIEDLESSPAKPLLQPSVVRNTMEHFAQMLRSSPSLGISNGLQSPLGLEADSSTDSVGPSPLAASHHSSPAGWLTGKTT